MSDNETEYTYERFNKFCEDAGIEHQFAAPYSPKQNGVMERKNRTIMEVVRFLLHDKGLLKKFWVEAAKTTVFLQKTGQQKLCRKGLHLKHRMATNQGGLI